MIDALSLEVDLRPILSLWTLRARQTLGVPGIRALGTLRTGPIGRGRPFRTAVCAAIIEQHLRVPAVRLAPATDPLLTFGADSQALTFHELLTFRTVNVGADAISRGLAGGADAAGSIAEIANVFGTLIVASAVISQRTFGTLLDALFIIVGPAADNSAIISANTRAVERKLLFWATIGALRTGLIHAGLHLALGAVAGIDAVSSEHLLSIGAAGHAVVALSDSSFRTRAETVTIRPYV